MPPITRQAAGITLVWGGTGTESQLDDRLDSLVSAFQLVHGRVPARERAVLQALNPLNIVPNVQTGAHGGSQEGGAEASWSPMGRGGAPVMKIGLKMFDRNKAIAKQPAGMAVVGGIGEGAGRGIADHVYDDHRMGVLAWSRVRLGKNAYQKQKAMGKGEAVIVHEIGHFLHAGLVPDTFWEMKAAKDPMSIATPMDLASQVSAYVLANNLLEFVAEVFTGLVYRRTYSAEVMAKYNELGGPTVN